MLYDLQLPVSIELGSTNMLIRDILKLSRGSVIEFDKLVSEPVDILVNGKKVAEGEVVVIDKHFGIRITSLVEPGERIKGIRR
ncbi:MAG: flagellar motor switch protein FliN [Ignavibacteria bacterium]|nr:flagellar motor switch protein FliN [Ignavibacteria bacterium]